MTNTSHREGHMHAEIEELLAELGGARRPAHSAPSIEHAIRSLTSSPLIPAEGSAPRATRVHRRRADANPIISHLDGTEGLKVSVCNDPACTGSDATITTVDSAGSVGGYSSIVIGTGTNPIISYFDWTNGGLKVAVIATPPGDTTTGEAADRNPPAPRHGSGFESLCAHETLRTSAG